MKVQANIIVSLVLEDTKENAELLVSMELKIRESLQEYGDQLQYDIKIGPIMPF